MHLLLEKEFLQKTTEFLVLASIAVYIGKRALPPVV